MAAGRPSDDFTITENEIALWVSHGIAAAAMEAYKQAVNVDGIETVPDGFYTTFKNIPLTEDTDTGYFYATLPSKAYGLPRGYDITRVALMGTGKLSRDLVRVSPIQIPIYNFLPKPKNSIFFWPEGNKIIVETFTSLSGKKLLVTMAGENSDMDEEIAISEDQIKYIVEYVMRWFMPTLAIPQDNSNDGINK
jgi:hypothetical protein